MTILKLPNEGDTYTGHVTTCGVEKGKYGEQVKFGFASGDLLYVGKVSADRQLIRCDFAVGGVVPPQVDYRAVVGNTLTFSRDHNKDAPDKPYWGITVAARHEAEPQPPTKRLSAPPLPSTVPGEAPAANRDVRASTGQAGTVAAALKPAPKRYGDATRDDVSAAYRWALGQSRGAQGDDAGPEAYQAGAATILIALDKQGLVPGFANLQLSDVKQALDLPDADSDSVPF